MNQNKTALYLVAIVGLVAAVGILTVLLNTGNETAYVHESDLGGEAVSTLKTSGTLMGTKGVSSTTNAGTECCDYTSDGKCITKCH